MKLVRPSFIFSEREKMRNALRYVVSDLQRSIRVSPEDYIEFKGDTPSIAVRLCVDLDRWTFRVGLSDFDPYHSEVCSASCVTEDTEVDNLLEQLIEDALNQCTAEVEK